MMNDYYKKAIVEVAEPLVMRPGQGRLQRLAAQELRTVGIVGRNPGIERQSIGTNAIELFANPNLVKHPLIN